MGANELMSLNSVLSGVGGRYEVQPDNRDKVCLLSNGTLYVANSYQKDHAVLAYIQLLRMNKFDFSVTVTSVEEIKRFYSENTPRTGKRKESEKQIEAVALIAEAVKLGASDIHFRNEKSVTNVWMRIDGFLRLVHSLKAEDGQALCGTMYSTMCDVADTHYKAQESQDGRIKQEFLHQCGLFGGRIATRPRSYGNLFVVRLLYNNDITSLDALGYDGAYQIPLIQRLTKRTDGINIFSGPTGSGKSTSLQVLLTMLLRWFDNSIHLLTIEDPPEYELAGAVQTPLMYKRDDPAEAAQAWVTAISNAMRLDPDTIMIGEMRDRMSAETAFRAAMTGHGVWTTLHANNAFQSLSRLIDMGVSPSLVMDASLVTGLINQSLAPVNCPACKRPYERCKREVAADVRERIEKHCNSKTVFMRGRDKTCNICGGKGYKGRTVVAETVMTTQRIMNAYRVGGAGEARSVWVKENKGMTKNMHLVSKVNAGLIDPELGEQKVCPIDYDLLTTD